MIDLNLFNHPATKIRARNANISQPLSCYNVSYNVALAMQKCISKQARKVLSLEALQNKWRLFGHVLQSHPETPAQKAMNYYFEKSHSKKFCGRPINTLPNTLHNDIIMLKKHNKFQKKYNMNQLK